MLRDGSGAVRPVPVIHMFKILLPVQQYDPERLLKLAIFFVDFAQTTGAFKVYIMDA